MGVTIGSNLPTAWAQYMGRAAAAWNNAGAKFRFEFVLDNKHKINLKSMPNYPLVLAMTHIYEGIGNYSTTDRDIDINSIFSWDVNGVSYKYDAWAVVTHELGHWLTLDDLRSPFDTAATMYYQTGVGELRARDLAADDVAGIKKIYGVR